MKASTSYISAGANRASSCAACTSTGILAFGTGPYLALWDTQNTSFRGVYATLQGHKGQVTTVKLVDEVEGRARLISGDTEGKVILWQQEDAHTFRSVVTWDAHANSSISALGSSSALLPNEPLYVYTGASDGVVKTWAVEGGQIKEVQKTEYKGRLPLDVVAAVLPGSKALVVVVAFTDRRIQVYTQTRGKLVHGITLEGHEDWVRCLSLSPYPSISGSSEDLILASGSQDNYIRLWRIAGVASATQAAELTNESGLDMLDEFERKLAGEAGGGAQISTKTHVLSIQDGSSTLRYDVTLEALLIGHESGLTNVRWSPDANPILLSTASDNSLVVWSPSSQGIWVPNHRFGAIGGRGLAFYGAVWGPEGRSVMASGWNGGWERWVKTGNEAWEVRPGLTGHHGHVQSIAWDPKGDYLASVGMDQTTRIHACCATGEAGPSTWAEIARPQIHGYDMSDIAWISPLRFASAADEKVARVFDAPGGFVESLASLGVTGDEVTADSSSRPKGATVPPLGLSNRALGKEAAALDLPSNRISNPEHESVSKTLTTVPTEEELATSTLWPEGEKVYGHGYELIAVAASHDGSMVASTCRASNAEHAVVRVHSTTTWDPIGQPLAGHTLTITRIAFSSDDQRILSVSRDRGWRVFRRDTGGEGFVLEAEDQRAHSRMILDAAWGEGIFATASRDKTIWSLVQDKWTSTSTIKLEVAATAVDMVRLDDRHLLAVGTEAGVISIHSVSADGSTSLELDVDPASTHSEAVNRVAWRPLVESRRTVHLASCSDDRSARIYDVTL